MAWINGQWVEDRPGFGGMLGGFGGQPRFAAGYTGDTSLDVTGGPMQPPPFGDRPGMPNLPPQMNPPGYSRGPQMQSPFAGMLGNIEQWNPVQQSVQQPQFQALPAMRARAMAEGQQAAMVPAFQAQAQQSRMPAVGIRPDPVGVNLGTPGSLGDWSDIRTTLPPITDLIDTGPQDTRTQKEINAADHAFNVAQREKTKLRLAEDRAKTKKHYAKLRAKGASPQTIAKAKAKSKARGTKIKAQHPTRRTITIDN